ncbi:serine hydrolase domain-containing protein [Nocardia sp. NPDC088792]|uniref:serine hydrolase domain-containing protein n=1 Tax=Nocardia sp. NPDC088792 TaxID=3364332 RepID=UPI00382DB8BD
MIDNTPQGTVAAGFESVRDVFAAIATSEGADYAAQMVAYRHGERVVDLWTGPAITGTSLLGAYSASKGAAHLVVARLAQDGVLDLDRPVAYYWPEFAVHGKQDILLRELLAHRAGLVGADTGFTLEELADDRAIAERLGAQRPYWRPGSAFGYHALVMAALSGEVVRRATGQSIQSLFAKLIGEPYGVDFHFGLADDQESRFVPTLPVIMTPDMQAVATAQATGPNSLSGIAFNRNNPHGPQVWELPNLEVIRRQGPASLGGVASGDGLARMYAAAIDSMNGLAPLLDQDTIDAVGQIHSIGYDLVNRSQKAFTPGFHATSEYYPVLGQGSFGHSGAGGQQAFADPRNGIAFGYTRRRFPFPAGPGRDCELLIPALYAAITPS